MNSVEILRVANGYVLRPPYDMRRNSDGASEEVFVFNDYQKMYDKLFELLNPGMNQERNNVQR